MTSPEPANPAAGRRRIPGWLEVVLLVVGALVFSIVLKAYVLAMFFVPSESMEQTLRIDDRILVEKVSYWRGEVERGDVVVFRDPGGWLTEEPVLSPLQQVLSVVGLYPTGGHLVKRVIAVGGDRVACCDAGRVTVNGVPVDESAYLDRPRRASQQEFSVQVPPGRLWVMGDNRANSEDSRFHQGEDRGTIAADDVVGKVWAVVWPLGHLGLLGDPGYDEDLLDARR